MEKKILIVDDDSDDLALMAFSLNQLGFKTFCYQRAKIALADIAVIEPDLIVTDIVMPDMEGIQFMSLVKEIYPDMPVMAISGVATYLEIMRELGATASVPKTHDFPSYATQRKISCNNLKKIQHFIERSQGNYCSI